MDKPVDIVNNKLPDQHTIERAAQTAHEAIDKVAAKAGPAVERVRSAAVVAAERLTDKAHAVGEWEDQWVHASRSYVRENPLTSVALGVLAGALLAKLATR